MNMHGSDDAITDASGKVLQLSDAVDALNANIESVLGRREELTAVTAEVVVLERHRRWTRRVVLALAVSLVLDVVLTAGIGHLYFKDHDAAKRDRRAALALCTATQSSWDYRRASIDIQTKPTTLSPEAARLFPASQTGSLRVQIAASNATRAAQRVQLLKLNGPRPDCVGVSAK